jgi:uncharacterized protein
VDSTFLLHAARTALPGKVSAATASAVVHPAAERDEAARQCAEWAVPHHAVPLDLLSVAGFADNPPDRCYRCKTAVFTALLELAERERLGTVVEGTNRDDLSVYRPGIKALKELGIASPLLESGLGKAEIRALSAAFGLATADKPSFACLASRFPYGTRLTPEGLARVEKCEGLLRELGFRQFRVRVHGDVARIEVEPEEIPRLLSPEVSDRIHEEFRNVGFLYVTADLKGFRSGSMDEGTGLVAGIPEELLD